jgi:hypothetical protein
MRVAGLSAALFLLPPGALAAEPPRPGPLPLPRSSGPVVLDGELGEDAWRDAAVIDVFYETAFGDNRKPTVKTTARLAYDDRYY